MNICVQVKKSSTTDRNPAMKKLEGKPGAGTFSATENEAFGENFALDKWENGTDAYDLRGKLIIIFFLKWENGTDAYDLRGKY
jgi:hypothetical protein